MNRGQTKQKASDTANRRRFAGRGPLRLVAIVLITGVAVAALVFGGYVIGQSVESAKSAETAKSQAVFVEIKTGRVERTLSFSGKVLPQMPIDLVYTGTGTITAVFTTTDSWLKPGSRILDVDGLPVFATDPTVFLPYRDLQQGDKGPDVTGLQTFLTDLGIFDSKIDGTFGPSTRRAVETMYLETSGLKRSVFLRSTVVLLDRRRKVDMLLVAPGQLIEAGAVIASLIDGSPIVHAEVSPSTARQLTVDDALRLDGAASSDPLQATVNEISEAMTTADGRVLQSIEIGPADDRDVRVGEKYRVTRVLESSEPEALIIPVLAVQTDGQGKTFIRIQPTHNATTPSERVDIQPGVSNGTHIAVTGIDLEPGTMIEIPGDPNA